MEAPSIGHNSGAMIADRVSELVITANRWITERPELTDQETADRCSAFIDQITAAAKEVETARKTEKQPHLDAAKAVDDRFRPLSDLLDKAKFSMKAKLTPWLIKLGEQRKAETRRKQEEADALAAVARAKEAEANRAAAQGGDVIGAMVAAERAAKDVIEAQKLADRIANAPINLKSNLGARTKALRTVKRANIVAPLVALGHYRNHPEIAAVVERLANADIRAGIEEIPGVEIIVERVV